MNLKINNMKEASIMGLTFGLGFFLAVCLSSSVVVAYSNVYECVTYAEDANSCKELLNEN